MLTLPAAIAFGSLPIGPVVVADAGASLVTALVAAAVALGCGIAVRLAVEARAPRIELRPARPLPRELERVA